MRALRIGVIGLGDICNAYLTNLQKYPDEVELYACACRTPEKARRKRQEPGRNSTASKRLMIQAMNCFRIRMWMSS